MPWNPIFPVGTSSVKSNRTVGQQNTSYIEVTMGNSIVGTNTSTTRDHFWNVGSDEDGRHRFIQSPGFTVADVATDPVLGVGMDAVFYAKETSDRIEWFHRNAEGIYQAVPSFLQGTVSIPSSSAYTTIVAIPANVYGEIFLYTTTQGDFSTQWGWFRSSATLVEGFSNEFRAQSSGDSACSVKLGNGSEAIGLNLRGRRADASGTIWNYRIIYRAL